MMKDWFKWVQEIHACVGQVPDANLKNVANLISTNHLTLTAGNGGSSSIASHAAQALLKPHYAAGDGHAAVCLSDNVPALTAHANDGGWDRALLEVAMPFFKAFHPTLLLFSSSGRSQNMVKLAQAARSFDCPIVAFTGFSGGPLRDFSTVQIHIDSDDYEVIEPVHEALLHRVQYHLRNSPHEEAKNV